MSPFSFIPSGDLLFFISFKLSSSRPISFFSGVSRKSWRNLIEFPAKLLFLASSQAKAAAIFACTLKSTIFFSFVVIGSEYLLFILLFVLLAVGSDLLLSLPTRL